MRKFIGIFLVSILSFNVWATEEAAPTKTTYWYTFDWNIDGEAKTEYIDVETIARGSYKAEISKDTNSNPRIYFEFHKLNDITACDTSEELTNVLKIDDQLISVTAWCKKYSDSELKYAEFTAATTEGISFILNKFKKSKSVKVDFGVLGWAYISAKGFSREWKSHANIL